MPQVGRKKPFSAKQKKQQLKAKREKKRRKSDSSEDDEETFVNQGGDEHCLIENEQLTAESIMKINYQKKTNPSSNANRYALHFYRESDTEIEERKSLARLPIKMVSPDELEIEEQDIFLPDDELAFPKRPVRDYNLTKDELDTIEYDYFKKYLEKLEAQFGSLSKLSYFEMNLETWRQLWRVIEMSDVILAIADIKHPTYHFPHSLYNYVVHGLNKEMILVLNKVDLVEAPLVLAWLHYFKMKYPKLHVIPFASYAGMKVKERGKHKGRRYGKFKMAAEGSRRLLKVLQDIVGDKVDLTSWSNKIDDELISEEKRISELDSDDDGGEEELSALQNATNIHVDHSDFRYYEWKKYDSGVLTIGVVGHPNVGKSSLMNAIIGKKVVSVSRTPGHTKHFQTIYLTDNVKLCDCPGLVFPSRAPKQMQVLMGCFPISQLREPYSVIHFLAARVNVPKILRLKKIDPESTNQAWSAFDICESWAVLRGYLTAKTGRPDVYRAANHLLRLTLDGRTLCLIFYPPNYWKECDNFIKDPDVNRIRFIQFESTGDVNQKGSEGGDEKGTTDEDSSEETEDGEIRSNLLRTANRFALLDDED
ncbi:guanine nucleotide-binding protein-like 1 [Tetranychus urticae]|uniref:Guanine nucleotide-binding protein-like 1 n=1 Tax=Tetranychus urticae TaxID=32264 RepID=T1L0H0_TETUR|nr:guanine nucleotide-binding protein-like 1 [Tetranychus urticae]